MFLSDQNDSIRAEARTEMPRTLHPTFISMLHKHVVASTSPKQLCCNGTFSFHSCHLSRHAAAMQRAGTQVEMHVHACRPPGHAVTLYTTKTPVLPDGGGGTRIVLAWVPYQGAKNPQTVLYSHPNALDLGDCIPYCMDLSKLLGVNVLTYDYTGYGCSEGLPSVRHSRADITAALKFLENHMDMSEKNIVLVCCQPDPCVCKLQALDGVDALSLHAHMCTFQHAKCMCMLDM